MSGLRPGQRAPEIDALTTQGTRWVLSQQQGLCSVIYFYPKAFTPGCTSETKMFRDNYVELLLAGASLVGVSTDDEKTQCEFAAANRVPFPIIPDDGRAITRAYEVLWPVLSVAQRYTFIVTPDMIIDSVFHHEVQIQRHRDDVLRRVNHLFRTRRSSGDTVSPHRTS